MSPASAPRATYRLQFNAGFTFDDAAKIAPYLSSLGVSHVYASPIQKARAGSLHGYDIVDHSQINPELGGEDGFRRLSRALAENGLKLLLDIVPNHMGVGGADNAFWLSVLEWGEHSPSASMFDIDWDRFGANRKLVLPFLGKAYGAALRAGELQLRFDIEEGSFSVWHWEHRFPLNPLGYATILEWAQVSGGGGIAMRPLYQIAAELTDLSASDRPVTQEGRVQRCERIKLDLAAHAKSSRTIQEAIAKAVSFACGDPRTPESFVALHRLLSQQSYRLAYWRVARSETNYRRFFDINSLAGVRVEDEQVFKATHALLFQFISEGLIHGLRIDHVDGLADPKTYLERLRARLGPDFYLVVEKILEHGEALPDWPISGTSGYEAMTFLDKLFIARQSEPQFTSLYVAAVGEQPEFDAQLRPVKLELLRVSFGSELETLVSDIKRAADADLVTSDLTFDELRRAISEIVAALPVYRTYLGQAHVAPTDRALLTRAVEVAKGATALETTDAHELVQRLLLIQPDAQRSPFRQSLLDRIARRFQQLTGPVMAKSLEDTLFYRYARFVALNEVGGDPSRFGDAPDEFHAFNAERSRHWPHALNATATHDMKRGEDVRARLAALSFRPKARASLACAADMHDCDVPDANDRYMLLQTIVGAWPVDEPECMPRPADDEFRNRLCAYAVKAVRESKRRSSWTAPDEAYEASLQTWIEGLTRSKTFKETLSTELPSIALAGTQVSLARLVLKLTMPGVPDTYQGCEFDDYSLADPDNRRAVDFATREASLGIRQGGFAQTKQAIIATLLDDRASFPLLYAAGDYAALSLSRDDVVCFSRTYKSDIVVVAVSTDPYARIEEAEIAETLPSPGDWRNLLRGYALEQRERGRSGLPAIVLRKSH